MSSIERLTIGLTNRCNLDCMFCPLRAAELDKCDMDIELVKKIIAEADVTDAYSLALFGESTLYKDLPEVISMLTKRTILYTNAVHLDKELSEEIIKAGLKRIVFSIDAFDSEDYQRIKGGDHFDTVMANFYEFVRIKNELQSDIFVIAKFAGLNYNTPKDEIDKKLAELRKIVTVTLGHYITWGGVMEWKGKDKRKVRELKPCVQPFKYMNIDSNGDCVMCCADYTHTIVLGNVKDQHVMDIWNGEKYEQLRREHTELKLSPICSQCERTNYY